MIFHKQMKKITVQTILVYMYLHACKFHLPLKILIYEKTI